MALAESTHTDTTPAAVPLDSFRIRIAIVRADKGWNYSDAEEATGVKAENWRLWEKTDRKPQKYETVCRQIADATGYSLSWLMAGGALRSRCSSGSGRSRGHLRLVEALEHGWSADRDEVFEQAHLFNSDT